MLSGAEQPDSGSVELGETVKLASVDQFRDDMNDKNTVYQEISEGHDIFQMVTTKSTHAHTVLALTLKVTTSKSLLATYQVVSATVFI